MTSEIRVNSITNRSGLSTVTWNDEGLNVVGVVTATSFVGNVTGAASQLQTDATGANLTLSGNLGVGGTITYEDVARVDATGISTFREGFGVGPLAGIALTAYADGSIRTVGIITASTFGSDTNSIFTTGGSERLRITSAGELVINDTAKLGDAIFGIKVNPSTHNGISFKPTSNGSFGALRTLNAAGSEVCNIQYDTTNANINFRTSNTQKATITSAGNVGVGTITPAGASGKTLDISGGSGQARLAFHNDTTGYAAGDGHQIYSDGLTFGIQNREAGSITFETNSTSRLLIRSDGNIGINTLGVSYSDHIYLAIRGNSTDRGGVVHLGNSDHSVTAQLSVYNSKAWFHTGTAHPLCFGTGGASQDMTLDTSNRLLVNTTTEGHGSADNLTINDSGTCGMTIRSGDTGEGNIFFSDNTSGSAEYVGMLRYEHNTDNMVVKVALTEQVRMRGLKGEMDISDTGGINLIQTNNSSNGIGTITIGKAKAGSDGCVQMMSYQAGSDTDQLGWKFKTHSSSSGTALPDRLFVIDHRGFVGIGTGVPDGDLKIHQAADENVSIVMQRTSCGGDIGSINWKCNATGTLGQINYRGGGGSEGIQFKTHNGSALKEYFRIHNDGGVRLWDSTEAYEAVDILHTGDAGNGTMVLQPVTNPGSGAASQYIYLKNYNPGSGGSTSMNLIVDGALSKGSGSFRIPHPLESLKDTKLLYHSFIEGPQCDNIYRGKVTLSSGTATVNLDTVSNMTAGTFVVLNRDIQCFTSNETGWDAVKGSVSGNILTITSQNNSSTDTISWMVVGERQDPTIKESPLTDDDGHLIVEGDKGGS